MKEFYLVVIAILAMTIGVLSTEIPTSCPLKDPLNKTIQIAHESDCTKFYKCLRGEKHEMICPEYKENERLCFNPKRQVCDWPWNVPCCKETKLPIDPHCPSPGNHTTAMWPHPISCNLYFTCKDGIKSLRSCGKGDLFDSELLECRHSGTVKCNEGFVCPPAGSSEIVIMPHDCDCMKYYKCISGELIRKQCPAGMKFDYIRKECVPAKEAVCNSGSSTVSSKPTPTAAPIRCPPGEIKDVPHERDCSSYYRCENGTRYLEHCTNGFYFDEIMSICTWWQNVDCGSRLPVKNITDEVPLTECPANGSYENVTLPHECSCDKYYRCQNSGAVLQRCKEGTVYDYVKQICDDPKVVKCERPIPEHEITPINTRTDPVITVSLLSIPMEIVCPGGGHVNIADPSDCQWYYECEDGNVINHWKCLNNHYFNPKVGQCDIPEHSNCIPISNVTTDTTTRQPPITLPSKCSGNGPCVIREPDPNDCSKYYQCEDGVKEHKTCREGLEYNKDSQMCDFPKYAGCEKLPNIKCTPNTPNGDVVPHDCQCNLFYVCENGESIRRECPEGTNYDYKKKDCISKDLAECYKKPETNVI